MRKLRSIFIIVAAVVIVLVVIFVSITATPRGRHHQLTSLERQAATHHLKVVDVQLCGVSTDYVLAPRGRYYWADPTMTSVFRKGAVMEFAVNSKGGHSDGMPAGPTIEFWSYGVSPGRHAVRC